MSNRIQRNVLPIITLFALVIIFAIPATAQRKPRLEFVRGPNGQSIYMRAKHAGVTKRQARSNKQRKRGLKKDPVLEADKVLTQYGKRLGLRKPLQQMMPNNAEVDKLNFVHVNYSQRHRQIPVFGSNLKVHFEKDGSIGSINGRIVPNIQVSKTKPAIKQKDAVDIALEEFKKSGRDATNIIIAKKGLFLFNRGLIENRDDPENQLVWLIEISNATPLIGELYFIDAIDGSVVLVLDDVRRIYRKAYDCSLYHVDDPAVSGACWSNKIWNGHRYGRIEGASEAGPNPLMSGSVDVDTLYEYKGLIHQYYADKFDRFGLNWKGGMGLNQSNSNWDYMKSQAHVEKVRDDDCISGGTGYFYDTATFCTGEAVFDIVMHEFTHAITYFHHWDANDQLQSMTYYGQAGALQENYSDVAGEFFEYYMSGDNDWLIGGTGARGAYRNLADPPDLVSQAAPAYIRKPDYFYHPDFYCATSDNGGVHWNANVPNKGIYLATAGGSFNGCQIVGIGHQKVEQILYRAVTQYYALTENFNGAYNGIVQACEDLIGVGDLPADVGTISFDDCAQVTAALQAVEMDQPGRCADPTEALRQVPLCAQAADQCPDDPNKTEPGQCGCGVADTDSDDDGIADCNDGCPSDPEKIAAGVCGCGVADTDSDGDGVANCNDQCPSDPNKTQPGQCGCGVADTDGDGDGVANCNDGCPSDPNKTAPGVCGCGVADTDSDGDGTADCNDGCPSDPNKTVPGVCGCGVADTDSDGDGVANCNDGCPSDPNKTAPGACGCGVSDVDTDGDGTADCNDGCPDDVNKIEPGVCDCGVADTDGNGNGIIDCLEQTISLEGTQSNDSITVTIGATAIDVRINSTTTSYDLATVVGINIDGLAGRDSISITGGEADETATLSPGAVVFAGAAYQINGTNVETISVRAGGGSNNEASLTGSAESNRLYSYKEYALLTDSPRTFTYRVDDFSSIAIEVPTTGRNYAFFYDSPGKDSLEADDNRVVFDRADGYTDVSAVGFSRAYVYGTSGGEDIAALSGATDDSSRFYSYPNYCILTSTKGSSYVYVNGFTSVAVNAAGTGTGTQYAYFYDGLGNDTLMANPYYTTMEREPTWSSPTEIESPGSTTTAAGFSRVYAYATRGGVDSAILVGSESSNRFRAYPTYATLSDQLSSFYIYTRGFKFTDAYGSDDASSNDTAYLYDSTGDDIFYGKDNYGYLADKAGVEFHNQVNDFDRVYARSSDRETDDDVVIDGTISYYLTKLGTW